MVIIFSGAVTAALCILIGRTGAEPDPEHLTAMVVGLFSGAMTSTPAFSAARATVTEGYEDIVSVGYGIAYIFGVIPMSLIVFVIVVIIFTILLQRKQYGMELYLVGTNSKASRFSGIKNERVILKTHVYGGILSAIAGIIIASGTNSAKASYGSSYVLRCLIVAILGGINPSGGFGKITGVVMAVLTIQFLSSGFGILRVDSYFQTFVWGAVLVGDMILNYCLDKLAENRKKKKAEKENA